MRKSLLFVLLALLTSFTSFSSADEYFVDSFLGNDSASGTDPSEAWRSLERVNKAELHAGDVVRFRRDCIWRGKLEAANGEKDSPIVYTDYSLGGEKFPPRIVNSVDLSSEKDWILVDDSNPDLKIWGTKESKLTFLEDDNEFIKQFAQGQWHIYTEGDSKAKLKETRFEELDNRNGYTLECVEPGTKLTNMQLSSKTFPVVAGRDVVFRFMARASVPCDLGAHVYVMEPKAPWNVYANIVSCDLNITTEWKEFSIAFHTTVDAENGRLTFFTGGSIPKDATFDFVPLPAKEFRFEGMRLTTDVGNIIFTDKCAESEPLKKIFAPTSYQQEFCGFKRWAYDELKSNYDFWYDNKNFRLFLASPENPGKLFDSIEAAQRDYCCVVDGHDVTIENMIFSHSASHGVAFLNSKRGIVRNCAFDWIGGGDLYNQGGDGPRVRYGNGVEFWLGCEDCLVEKCRFSRVYDVAVTTQGPDVTGAKNLLIRDCLMYRCEQAFEIWFTNSETKVEGLVFENNLCVDCGRDWSHIQRPDKRATAILAYGLNSKIVDITIRKNVFYETAQYFNWALTDRVKEYKIDDNVYWAEPSKSHEFGERYFCYDAGKAKETMTFEAFRAETGLELNSRWVEPKFQNYEFDDFTLLNADELEAGPRGVDWKPLW